MLIGVLLGGIGYGEFELYRWLDNQRVAQQEAAKPVSTPPPAPVVAKAPEPEPEPAPPSKPKPPPKPKPKPFSMALRDRKVIDGGRMFAASVQGTNREKMRRLVALEALGEVFRDEQAKKAFSTVEEDTATTWTQWMAPAIEETNVERTERGLITTYRVDLAEAKQALSIRGVAFDPMVPSFQIDVNGTYSGEGVVLDALMETLRRKSPYFLGKAMYASPQLVEQEINELTLMLDGRAYAVRVKGTRDFGGTALGRSILYTVDVIPG